MATNVTEWIPYIAGAMPMCPDPVIERAVVDACRDFCQHTLLWDENMLTAINIVDGTHTYTLASTSGDIAGVDYVEVDSVPIFPTSVNEMNKTCVEWRDVVATRSTRYVVGMANSIRLIYEPDEDVTGGLKVWVCLKPLEAATSVQDFLWRDYQKAIADGAKAALLEMPGMEWTNPQLGAFFQEKYEAARATAMMKKFTGRTRHELMATPVFFA